jgi:CxxC motif-containing protein
VYNQLLQFAAASLLSKLRFAASLPRGYRQDFVGGFMKHLICISCPKGCHLAVDEQNGYTVTGNSCPRGEIYGKTEIKNPQRIVTSTVAVSGSTSVRCPVKTERTISKRLMFEAMKTLDGILVQAPIKCGQIIVQDICGTGVNFIATKGIDSCPNT